VRNKGLYHEASVRAFGGCWRAGHLCCRESARTSVAELRSGINNIDIPCGDYGLCGENRQLCANFVRDRSLLQRLANVQRHGKKQTKNSGNSGRRFRSPRIGNRYSKQGASSRRVWDRADSQGGSSKCRTPPGEQLDASAQTEHLPTSHFGTIDDPNDFQKHGLQTTAGPSFLPHDLLHHLSFLK